MSLGSDCLILFFQKILLMKGKKNQDLDPAEEWIKGNVTSYDAKKLHEIL